MIKYALINAIINVATHLARTEGPFSMSFPTIHILVATTSGNTEYLADEVAALLEQQGLTSVMHYEPNYSELIAEVTDQNIWLCCVASHGAGEYGDSMLDFSEQLSQQKPNLSPLKYAVIAVGDSCYDTYCQAGKDCDAMLQLLGAKKLLDRLEIDMSCDDPIEKSSTWLPYFIQAL